jgi:hypothetical protein
MGIIAKLLHLICIKFKIKEILQKQSNPKIAFDLSLIFNKQNASNCTLLITYI